MSFILGLIIGYGLGFTIMALIKAGGRDEWWKVKTINSMVRSKY